jgi:hypothetical protein
MARRKPKNRMKVALFEEEEELWMVGLYTSGLSIRQISERFRRPDVTYTVVRRVLLLNNVPLRPLGPRPADEGQVQS